MLSRHGYRHIPWSCLARSLSVPMRLQAQVACFVRDGADLGCLWYSCSTISAMQVDHRVLQDQARALRAAATMRTVPRTPRNDWPAPASTPGLSVQSWPGFRSAQAETQNLPPAPDIISELGRPLIVGLMVVTTTAWKGSRWLLGFTACRGWSELDQKQCRRC